MHNHNPYLVSLLLSSLDSPLIEGFAGASRTYPAVRVRVRVRGRVRVRVRVRVRGRDYLLTSHSIYYSRVGQMAICSHIFSHSQPYDWEARLRAHSPNPPLGLRYGARQGCAIDT